MDLASWAKLRVSQTRSASPAWSARSVPR